IQQPRAMSRAAAAAGGSITRRPATFGSITRPTFRSRSRVWLASALECWIRSCGLFPPAAEGGQLVFGSIHPLCHEWIGDRCFATCRCLVALTSAVYSSVVRLHTIGGGTSRAGG